jgi:hypothetical protein
VQASEFSSASRSGQHTGKANFVVAMNRNDIPPPSAYGEIIVPVLTDKVKAILEAEKGTLIVVSYPV